MATQEPSEEFLDSVAQRGFPRAFEKAYNDLRNAALRNSWQALTRLAATSFGKGVLLAGVAFLALPAIGVGIAAATGALTVAYAGATIGVGSAMLGGMSIGAGALFTPLGMALAGTMGVLNAGLAWTRETSEIAALRQDAEARLMRRGIEAEQELHRHRAAPAPHIQEERSTPRAEPAAPRVAEERTPAPAPRVTEERAPAPAPRVEESRPLPRPEPTTQRPQEAESLVMQQTPAPANDAAPEQTTFRDRFAQKAQATSFVAAEQQRRASATFPPGRSDV